LHLLLRPFALLFPQLVEPFKRGDTGHGEELGIGERQRSSLLESFQGFRIKGMQGGFVDAVEALEQRFLRDNG
jgi:hypothetical protein